MHQASVLEESLSKNDKIKIKINIMNFFSKWEIYRSYLVLHCNPYKLYIFHHMLRPNNVPLDLGQKTHWQCNSSKFLIDIYCFNDDRHGRSLKYGKLPIFAQKHLHLSCHHNQGDCRQSLLPLLTSPRLNATLHPTSQNFYIFYISVAQPLNARRLRRPFVNLSSHISTSTWCFC